MIVSLASWEIPSICRVDSPLSDIVTITVSSMLVSRSFSYSPNVVPSLVKGSIPQRRVLDLAPGIGDVQGSDGGMHLTNIIERSMSY